MIHKISIFPYSELFLFLNLLGSTLKIFYCLVFSWKTFRKMCFYATPNFFLRHWAVTARIWNNVIHQLSEEKIKFWGAGIFLPSYFPMRLHFPPTLILYLCVYRNQNEASWSLKKSRVSIHRLLFTEAIYI